MHSLRTVLNAFVNKVENAKGYIEYLSPEGKDIVQAYESDKDNCKTLLFAAKKMKFFLLLFLILTSGFQSADMTYIHLHTFPDRLSKTEFHGSAITVLASSPSKL